MLPKLVVNAFSGMLSYNIALDLPKIELVDISPRIAIQNSRLPGEIHGDLADKILVATARETSSVLVTHDSKLINYGKGKFITVHDPC
ncbi:MAG: hypothetical protein AAGG81_03615 [Chlamydiota bacterium]